MNMFRLRKSILFTSALLVAIGISYFFSFAEIYWIPLAVLSVMQTEVGLTVRQVLQNYLGLLGMVIVGSLLSFWNTPLVIILLLSILVFCVCVQGGKRFYALPFLFFVSATGLTADSAILYLRVYDITIGMLIGLTFQLLIFPIRPDVSFRQGIIVLLNFYCEYLDAIYHLLMKEPDSVANALLVKSRLEMGMRSQSDIFPNWVYEPGLSHTLQPGHRHFLIGVERLSEILMALHQSARHTFSTSMLAVIKNPFHHYIIQSMAILQALISVFRLSTLSESVSDLKAEWVVLEKKCLELVPPSFEIMDPNPDYFALLALLEDCKDLRVTLIGLGNSLQSACSPSSLRH